MRYLEHFSISPERPLTVPFDILDRFVDVSWHHDTAPSFENKALLLVVFVDYDNPTDRECGYLSKKYRVFRMYDSETSEFDAYNVLLATDDYNEFQSFLDKETSHERTTLP